MPSQPSLELLALPAPSAMGPSSRAGAGGPGKGGHYRGQLWGGEELLELLELLLLLLQEVSLLLRQAEAGGQNTDHGKGQGNTPPTSSQTPSDPGGERQGCAT